MYSRICEGQIWVRSDQLRFVTEALATGGPQPIKGANGTHLLTKREEEIVQVVRKASPTVTLPVSLNLTEHRCVIICFGFSTS